MKRVLIFATYGFSIRYLMPTGVIEQMAKVCTPVIGLGWRDAQLEEALDALGVAYVHLPDARMGGEFRRIKRRLDVAHDRALGGPTPRIKLRRRRRELGYTKRRAIFEVRRLRDRLLVSLPGGMDRSVRSEALLFLEDTNASEFRSVIDGAAIDMVVSLTPYHEQDYLGLFAARSLGIPSFLSIISFDNPTTRGRLPVRGERIAVWNSANAEEVLRAYPELESGDIRVVGAPQFDLHFEQDLIMSEHEWRRELGIADGRPVILYGAGPPSLVPNEELIVALIDQAIGRRLIRNSPLLLVRPHPVDRPDRWDGIGPALQHALVSKRWGDAQSAPVRAWPTHDELRMQISSLLHCSVHVNVCSSMTIDGALLGRPQVAPAFLPDSSRSARRTIREFYRQEHWRGIAESGGLNVAADFGSLVSAINAGIEQPAAAKDGQSRLVTTVLTYADGKSSERLVAEIGAFLHEREFRKSGQPRTPTQFDLDPTKRT